MLLTHIAGADQAIISMNFSSVSGQLGAVEISDLAYVNIIRLAPRAYNEALILAGQAHCV